MQNKEEGQKDENPLRKLKTNETTYARMIEEPSLWERHSYIHFHVTIFVTFFMIISIFDFFFLFVCVYVVFFPRYLNISEIDYFICVIRLLNSSFSFISFNHIKRLENTLTHLLTQKSKFLGYCIWLENFPSDVISPT